MTARTTNQQQPITNLSGLCQQQCPAFLRTILDEADRASNFREILQDSGIDISRTQIEGTKFNTDGDIQSQGFRHTIIEIKNEIGSGGAKPHAQGISYYIHSTKSSVAEMPGFSFPCILITLFGKLTVFHR
jgi:hypothetical protein